MKIKKIVANDNREAFKQAVELFGKDAIILSSKETMHGVEVFASDKIPKDNSYLEQFKTNTSSTNLEGSNTIIHNKRITEFNEFASLKYLLEEQLSSLIWDNKLKKDPIQAQVIRHLFNCGYEGDIIDQLIMNLPKVATTEVDFVAIWQEVVQNLINFIEPNNNLNITGAIAFHGLNGVGKTTAIMKLAAKYALAKGSNKIAIVSMSTDQIGKLEELNIYSKILNIAAYTVDSKAELEKILLELKVTKELILVDVSFNNDHDNSHHDKKMFNAIDNHVLVLDGSMQYNDAQHCIEAFADITFLGAILTKLDYATTLGAVLSALINYQIIPLYTTNGVQIPDSIMTVKLTDLFYHSLNLSHFANNENLDVTISRKYSRAYINEH